MFKFTVFELLTVFSIALYFLFQTITYTLARADVQTAREENNYNENNYENNTKNTTENDIKSGTRIHTKMTTKNIETNSKIIEENTKKPEKTTEKTGKDMRRNRCEDESESKIIRAQNQVALILICELNENDLTTLSGEDLFDQEAISRSKIKPPPIIIATTHLKVSNNLILYVCFVCVVCIVVYSLSMCKIIWSNIRPPPVITHLKVNSEISIYLWILWVVCV